jgi:callose synthase
MLQKDGDSSKRSAVVLLLQDMLEVVTRDMMVNEIRLVNFDSFILEENI